MINKYRSKLHLSRDSFRKDNMLQNAKRSFVMLLGSGIGALGITMFYLSGFGNDPITVFCDGLSKTFYLSLGTATSYYNISFLIIAFLFATNYIRIGTVILAVTLGQYINLFDGIIRGIMGSNPDIYTRLITFCIAEPVMAAGFGICISARYGTGASDAFLLTIVDKTGWQYRYLKIACDATFVLVGMLIGGAVGLGTIAAVFLSGPIIDATNKLSHKTLLSWLGLNKKAE